MRFNDVQNFKFEVPLWIIHTFHKVKARLKIFIPVCILFFFYCETILALEEQDIQLCTGKDIFFFFLWLASASLLRDAKPIVSIFSGPCCTDGDAIQRFLSHFKVLWDGCFFCNGVHSSKLSLKKKSYFTEFWCMWFQICFVIVILTVFQQKLSVCFFASSVSRRSFDVRFDNKKNCL